MFIHEVLEDFRLSAKSRNRNGINSALSELIKLFGVDDRVNYAAYLAMKYIDLYEVSQLVDEGITTILDGQVSGSSIFEPLKEGIGEGVSLVTCCMNRNKNLLLALPTWLELDEIDEILIVDWSSQVPVARTLEKAGIRDSRIQIIRVDSEDRWILTYAFNIGFRASNFDKVVKVDSDIQLSKDFFRRNKLSGKSFIAGDWRLAKKGQEYTNGFFYAFRETLIRIGGFNEFIITYGWDDEDIYHRLEQDGNIKIPVALETLYHLHHEESERINVTAEISAIEKSTRFLIRYNKNLVYFLPAWQSQVKWPKLIIKSVKDNVTRIVRANKIHNIVPENVRDFVRHYTLTELLSWKLGMAAYYFSVNYLNQFLSIKDFDLIDKFDAIVAKGAEGEISHSYHCFIITNIHEPDDRFEDFIRTLVTNQFSHHNPVIIKPKFELNYSLTRSLFVVDIEASELNELRRIFSLDELASNQKEHVVLELRNEIDLKSRSLIKLKEEKVLYIDVRHGLGNRLRAMASAAIIAKNTERELRIIWVPDEHCEASFSDLFDTNLTVISKPLSADEFRGMHFIDYMGNDKGQIINVSKSDGLLIRSAFSLNSPMTSWHEENDFLRSLSISPQVEGLIGDIRTDGCVGVHVRMQGSAGTDINSFDCPSNWSSIDHQKIVSWRNKSHYSNFVRKLQEERAKAGPFRLFLAADLPEVYDAFSEAFGDDVTFLQRNCYDRSSKQVQYALADLYLLSKCQQLYGSNWSSFTEIAHRLSSSISVVELSGVDF